MTVPDGLVPFLGVVAVLTVTPGPDMLLVLRNGLAGGPATAWATGLGCCTGIAAYALGTTLGLSAALTASPGAFGTVKALGAAYLVYLGASSIVATVRAPARAGRGTPQPGGGPEPGGAEEAAGTRRVPSPREAYRQGLVSNLLNPKIALLFLTLIPQFVGPDEPRRRTFAVLALTFLAIAVGWWRVFSLGIAALGRVLQHPGRRQWIERLTGGVLVALGLRALTT